ncbi:MAG: hypothetical protein DRR00_26380, partial [Candidatus Parabeggiatoa sp. nov. 3]
KKKGERGQPQGIAPTGAVVGAIPCGCPLRYKYLFICASVLTILVVMVFRTQKWLIKYNEIHALSNNDTRF